MLWHSYQRALEAKLPAGVMVATDSQEVADVVEGWGGNVIMTSPDCTSGTERIASVIDELDGDIIVNVQGDEPLIDPDLIDSLIEACNQSTADLVFPVRRIDTLEELTSMAAVKAVLLQDNSVIYLSRNAVPLIRDERQENWLNVHDYWVVIGTAAFRKTALQEYRTWQENTLERLEKIEQFRFLENGKRVLAVETDLTSVAVDLPEDLEKVRRIVEAKGGIT
jgi:3-deoxy-manno-octulosonate cytidylyltransferase (CMP-KDO synthetase)